MHGPPRISLLGDLHFVAEADKGRNKPAFDGYRASVQLDARAFTTIGFHFLEDGPIWPGDSVPVEASLLLPASFPASLRVGRIVDVSEGGRLVAGLEVVEIVDGVLDGDVASAAPTGAVETLVVDVVRWEPRRVVRAAGDVCWHRVVARDRKGEELPFWPPPGLPTGYLGRTRLTVCTPAGPVEDWNWAVARLPVILRAEPLPAGR